MDINNVKNHFLQSGYTIFIESKSNHKNIYINDELTLEYLEDELEKMREEDIINEVRTKINLLA